VYFAQMKCLAPILYNLKSESTDPSDEAIFAPEEDLWFLPGPLEDEPDYLPPWPRSDQSEAMRVDDRKQAEVQLAARALPSCFGMILGRHVSGFHAAISLA